VYVSFQSGNLSPVRTITSLFLKHKSREDCEAYNLWEPESQLGRFHGVGLEPEDPTLCRSKEETCMRSLCPN
jgi:hypothetical protein